MKERLVQLLDLEQLSPSKFADIIGVQRSSVSHVISGRNKPSYDFLQKTLTAFPGLNAEWLIMGKGTMYEQMGRGVTGNLFDSPEGTAEALSEGHIPDNSLTGGQQSGPQVEELDETVPQTGLSDRTKNEDAVFSNAPDSEDIKGEIDNEEQKKGEPEKQVVQVMVFYDDDTFHSYHPSK